MNLELREKGLQRTKATFIKLMSRVEDMSLIWKDFLPFYRQDVLKKAFDTHGKVFGDNWKPLKPSTMRSYKTKNSTRTLRRTDALYNAATKGSGGWFEKVSKNNLNFGIDLPYASAQQYGCPKRNLTYSRFFFDDKEDLAPSAWVWLIKRTNEHLEVDDVK